MIPNLTPAEAERLAILLEEMGEAQQVIGKILRHGYESYHPDDPAKTHNSVLLEKELGDIQYILRLMCNSRDVNSDSIHSFSMIKEAKIQKYLHHQEARS